MTETPLWLPVIGKGRKQSIRSLPPGGYDSIPDCMKRDRSSQVARRLATFRIRAKPLGTVKTGFLSIARTAGNFNTICPLAPLVGHNTLRNP